MGESYPSGLNNFTTSNLSHLKSDLYYRVTEGCDSDATNDHGKKSNVVSKIKQAAKPNITAEQLQKAREYVTAGGDVTAIESKYKLSALNKKELNDIKSKDTKEA